MDGTPRRTLAKDRRVDSGTYSPVFVRFAWIFFFFRGLFLASALTKDAPLARAATRSRTTSVSSSDGLFVLSRVLRTDSELSRRAGHTVTVGDTVDVTRLNKERTVFGWPGMA